MKDSGNNNGDFSCFLFLAAIIIVVMFWQVILAAVIFGTVAFLVIKMLSSASTTPSKYISSSTTVERPPVIPEEKPAPVLNTIPQISAPAQFTNTSETQVVSLVGVTYDGRQLPLSRMKAGDNITLLRRPNNPSDRNAVEVLNTRGESIGWLPRYIAAKYAPIMDGGKQLFGQMTALVGGTNGKFYGARLCISLTPIDGTSYVQRHQPNRRKRKAVPPSPMHPPYITANDYNVIEDDASPSEAEQLLEAACLRYQEVLDSTWDYEDDEEEDQYDEDSWDDLYAEGLGIGDVTFQDCDSEY